MCGRCFLKPVPSTKRAGVACSLVAFSTDLAAIAKKKRIAIWMMVGGLVAGFFLAGLTSWRWAMLGTAVFYAGWTLFSLADPKDRPPPKA
jgi:hypothetical protein